MPTAEMRRLLLPLRMPTAAAAASQDAASVTNDADKPIRTLSKL
jgi:hypothetical protein